MKHWVYFNSSDCVNFETDDTVILEKTLRAIAGEIKSAVWKEDFHLALQYCNMYIDLEEGIQELKDAIARKEAAEDLPEGEDSGNHEDLEGDQEGE